MKMEKGEDDRPLLPSHNSPRVGKAVAKKARPMSTKGIMAAVSYMTCAVLLVMFNKAALSSYGFPCANVVTLLQMASSNVLLYTLRNLNMIIFTAEPATGSIAAHGGREFVPLKTIIRASPLSAAYLLYMMAGMASLRGVNIPMYTTLRRTTVVFTMFMEFFIAGRRHSRHVVASVLIIACGAVIAGMHDVSFSGYGYGIVILSNLTTAIYLATIARLGKSTGLNSFGLMWCNGVICAPLLLIWTIASGEMAAAMSFQHKNTWGFRAVIVMSCLLAFALNYTIFLNTALNSALTQTMCGNLKDLGTVGLGWMLFGGLTWDPLNILGQSLGFAGSGMYAYCKLKGI